MIDETLLFALLIALVLDWYFGEPDILWSRVPHPIILFGRAVSFADRTLNLEADSDSQKYKKGALAITLLIGIALLLGVLLDWVASMAGWFGILIEILVVFVLLAQKSLHDHVAAVASGLTDSGLAGGREAVGMIVGRDPETLDGSGVSRAAIESLAENFSDGVVAPAFWFAVFGLPGIMVYKMINTADSMIAYKNEKYLLFGRVAAQIDDIANWLPARLSALLIGCAAGFLFGLGKAKSSLVCAFRDSGLHRSPNAGWPEGAMAGALNIAVGGPRDYGHERVAQSFINASGKVGLDAEDILAALRVFSFSCFALWIYVFVGLLLL